MLSKITYMKYNVLFFILSLSGIFSLDAQETFPVNGTMDSRENYYYLTGGVIHLNPDETLEEASMIIRKGKILAIGKNISVPEGAIIQNLNGQHVYPSFIELSSTYGVPPAKKQAPPPNKQQLTSGKSGAFSWNESLIPEYNAASEFNYDKKEAAVLRENGFGVVLTHRKNGVVQGSGLLTTLQNASPHFTILNEKASSHLAFSRAKSNQSTPTSQMGMIALIRQLYLNGEWYQLKGHEQEKNLSLAAWQGLKQLPQLFEVQNKLEVLRAAKIAREYNKLYIIKGAGDEYQRAEEIASTGIPVIVPVNFPKPYDVEDPLDQDIVSLAQMKHWEWAPANLAVLAKHQIPFAITSDNLSDKKQFLPNVRKAIQYGLDETEALRALTIHPAKWLGESNRIGQLKTGYLANFFITDEPVFQVNSKILEHWIQGVREYINTPQSDKVGNQYELELDRRKYTLQILEDGKKFTISLKDAAPITGKITEELDRILLGFQDENKEYMQLTGYMDGQDIRGMYINAEGVKKDFVAVFKKKQDKETLVDSTPVLIESSLTYPLTAYGRPTLPEAKTFLIENTTVWTNTDKGVLKKSDILIHNGKIVSIGKISPPRNAVRIDGTDLHLTPGIIDEHSHIAISKGVNEGSLSSTAAVRIGDVINPDDINIYRQLAGGVTTSHLLHGSANPIGGQAALIKLRWGEDAEGLKFKGADPFIKFALGENVKQSNWGERNTVRFPQTRIGVEQVFEDHFTRAKEYGEAKKSGKAYRKDLEMETLLEILQGQRFITCHSYVQSEINMLIHLADRYGFRVNTFTHILEGYKVADKMKKHGVAAATFSDWWAYKYEVIDAIPYNAAIMHDKGVLTAVNSDDAEMARRLNTEAGKSIKYGGLSEEEALKLVTLNPARMLHIDDRVGKIEAGMDADVVLWSDNPLSIYARVQKTFIDGKLYFDRSENAKTEEEITSERHRLIQAMIGVKNGGSPTQKAERNSEEEYRCKTGLN